MTKTYPVDHIKKVITEHKKSLVPANSSHAVKTVSKYSEEQINDIKKIIIDCEALIKKYPMNIEARKTLARCKGMLGII